MTIRIFGAVAASAKRARRRQGSGSPPSFISAPVVIGQPTVGVPVSFTGGTVSGSPTPTVTRQWLLDGANIPGATNLTYTPSLSDAGKALSVRETATNTNGAANSTSATKTIGSVPAVTSAPSITGTPVVGTPVVYTAGVFSGIPAPTITRQWLRDGSPISGATGASYTPVAADAGTNRLSLRETATNIAGSVQSTSATATVNQAPAFTAAPVILGTPTVGTPVSYVAGTVTGFPTPTVTRQWLLDGATISGATSATYTPVTGDIGTNRLSVRETATNAVASANSTSTAVSVVAAGAQTQASDWIARSTAPGVTAAYELATSAEVLNFRHIDGTQGNITLDTTDGPTGACMKIAVPASAGANSGLWRAPLNTAWTQDNQGFNTGEFYFQYRVKLGPRRLRPSSGGGGFKTMILSIYQFSSPNSSASAQPFEIVHNTSYLNGGIIQSYRQDGVGFPPLHESKSYGLSLQPGVDWGAGLPDQRRFSIWNSGGDVSPGNVSWEEGVWITVYCRVKITTYGGSAGNEYDMWVAWPGDTSYTLLYNNRNFTLGPKDAQFSGGFNGIWFLPYDTGRSSADYDTWHKYAQLIVSTQPIACPLPLEAPPSWYSSPAAKTWQAPVSNTVSSVFQLGTAGLPAGTTGQGLFAWSSGTTHRGRGSLRHFGGGHTDQDVNSMFEVRLRSESPAWTRLTNPSASTGGTSAEGIYGDGQPRSPHSWQYLCDVPGDGTWMAGLPGVYSNGANSGRFFRFDDSTLSWQAKGYHPNASSSTTLSDVNSLGKAFYDPKTGLIHVTVNSNGRSWTINPFTNAAALRSATAVSPLNFGYAAAIAWRRRCIVIWKPSAGFRVFDIDGDLGNGTIHSPPITGTGPSGTDRVGMVWHEASGAFLAWGHTSGTTTIFKLTPPALQSQTFTGTWTWSSVTVDASNSVTPAAINTGGSVIPSFAILNDFGGLRKDLLVLHHGGSTAPVYTYKLPVGGV